MAGHLAIVAYRALVDGLATGKVDIQVRWFAGDDPASVRRLVESDPVSSYRNPEDEVVSWEISGVLAIEPFDPRESGDGVIGVIASIEELAGLA